MLKRSHIRQFLALVDAGTFTQAAHRLRITQPTLSVDIAELERIVGAPLFQRSRRGVNLTAKGGAFLPLARDLEQRFRLADGFGQATEEGRPNLRIGVIRTVPSTLVGRAVRTFSREFQVELHDGRDYDLRALLAADRLDVALLLLRPDEADDTARLLFEEPYAMILPEGHRFAGLERVRPEQLASEPMIARRACEALAETSRFFTRNGVRPRFAYKSDNDERCLTMVAAGIGITSAPLSLAIEGTVPLAVEGYDLRRRIGFLTAARTSDMPAVASCLDALGASGVRG